MEQEIKKAKVLTEMLNDKELKALQILQLAGIRKNTGEIAQSQKILADEYSNELINTVENDLLYEIMEHSGILEEDDGDLVTDRMKEIITQKIIAGELNKQYAEK